MLGTARSGVAARDRTYLTGRTGIAQPKVAGKHVLSNNGEPVNSSKLDHMRELIHVEQPAAPILDQHTTYNRNHSKDGFPNHYRESAEKEYEYKPQEVYYTGVPGNKRHPFEVKSMFTCLTAEEPLHDKSATMLTVEVPKHLEPEILKSELAKKGHHVVKSFFEHNTITNERNGKGFVQVRAANPRYHEEIKKEIDNIGLKFGKPAVGEAQPNRNKLSTIKRA